MKVKVIDSEDAFWSLRDSWNAVLDRSNIRHVCLSFEWLWSWWAAFGAPARLHILLAYEAEELVGIAPLMICRGRISGVGARKVQFLYNDNAPCADFIIAKEKRRVLKLFLDFLLNEQGLWDAIELNNIPCTSQSGLLWSELCSRAGLSLCAKKGLRSPYISIVSDWQEYCRRRGKKFLKTLRNITNRMHKSGTHDVDCIRDSGAALSAFADIVSISARSWKRRCRNDLSHRQRDRGFFKQICRMFGENNAVRVWILRLNNRAIAYEFHLTRGNEVYALKSDFDESFKSLSPGTYLDAYITRHYFQTKVKNYNLCGHDDEVYKLRWTVLKRDHMHYLVYKPTAFGSFLYYLDAKVAYPLKEALKQDNRFYTVRRFIMGRR